MRLHTGAVWLGWCVGVGAGRSELATNDVPVHSARASQPTLDDVFLHLTGRSLREDTASPAEEAEPADPDNPVNTETTEALA